MAEYEIEIKGLTEIPRIGASTYNKLYKTVLGSIYLGVSERLAAEEGYSWLSFEDNAVGLDIFDKIDKGDIDLNTHTIIAKVVAGIVRAVLIEPKVKVIAEKTSAPKQLDPIYLQLLNYGIF